MSLAVLRVHYWAPTEPPTRVLQATVVSFVVIIMVQFLRRALSIMQLTKLLDRGKCVRIGFLLWLAKLRPPNTLFR